ncbi:MAG: hypothetical protein MJZ61_03880 [Bacteroidales bacterium]|nr:hypothetical protein [Bacteroidales bacterium]
MEQAAYFKVNIINEQAKAFIEFIKGLSFIEIDETHEPNDETLQAMKDCEEGNTYKAKDAKDMMNWLMN